MAVTTDYSVDFLSTSVIPTYVDNGVPLTSDQNDVIGLVGGGWAVTAEDSGGFMDVTFYDQNGNLIGQNFISGEGRNGALTQLTGGDVLLAEAYNGAFAAVRFNAANGVEVGSRTIIGSAETAASVSALSTGGYVLTGQHEVTSGDSNIEVHIRDASTGGVDTDFEIDGTTANDTNACVVGLNDGGFAVMFNRGGNPYYAVYENDGSVRVAPALVSAFGASGEMKGVATADGGAAFTYVSGGFEEIFAINGDGNLTSFRALGSGATDSDITQLSNGILVSSYSYTGVDVRGAIYDLPSDTIYGDTSTSPPHIALDESTDTTIDTSIAAIGMGRFITTWNDTTTGHAVQSLYQLVRTSTGDSGDNTITGDEAVDIMNGGGGYDTLDGGANNDVLSGGDLDDQITVGTGSDTVDAGAGSDQIFMDGNLDSTDHIDGGADGATLYLTGDYSAGVVLGADTIKNVGIVLTSGIGNSYALTFNNGNVAAGQNFSVRGETLNSPNNMTINGSAELDGTFTMYAGFGTNTLTGGHGADTFHMGATLGADDKIDGGAGSDTVVLDSSYPSLSITAAMLKNVETLTLGTGTSYGLTMADGVVASGKTLTVNASSLNSIGTFILDASAETNGFYKVIGSTTNDVISLGARLVAGSQVHGGGGSDSLDLNGDYSAGVTVTGTMLSQVQTVNLAAGHSYKFTFTDGVVAAHYTLMLDGSILGAGDKLTFNGSAETDGTFTAIGGEGDDSITGGHKGDVLEGGGGKDTINFSAGGNDQVYAESGNDVLVAGAALNAGDRIDGGDNSDTLRLNGDYSHGVTFGATTVLSVEAFIMAAGHDYKLVLADGTVASTATLTVDATALTVANRLILNGGAETNGHLTLKGGAGNDVLTGGTQIDTLNGGGGNDRIDTSKGGSDIVKGGAGDDTIVTGTWTASDTIDGGSGFDNVVTSAGGIAFRDGGMVNVEKLTLTAGQDCSISFKDTIIAKGDTLIVDASALGKDDALQMFFAGDEKDGSFDVRGGKANDSIEGGQKADILKGGLGRDEIYSFKGHDIFVYSAVAQSTGANCDYLHDADLKADKFDLDVSVTGIDAACSGALAYPTFDHDLAAIVGKHQLKAHHALIFNAGGAGVGARTYLVVDANGKAGYQAGHDYVLEIAYHSDGNLDVGDFIQPPR